MNQTQSQASAVSLYSYLKYAKKVFVSSIYLFIRPRETHIGSFNAAN